MSMLASWTARPRRARVPEGRRIYAIGDVHGRLDLLESLYDRIGEDNRTRGAAETEIILLGDLIDRGPDSAGVVRWAMRTDPSFAQLVTLKGNHEASLNAVLAGDLTWLESWLRYGGTEALKSWGVDAGVIAEGTPDQIAAAARAAVSVYERHWLASLPVCRQVGDYYFVHAGVRPGVAIEEQQEADLLWIRGEFLDHSGDHGPVVVHGHSISERVEERTNRIGIDTGAYFSDRLTAIGIEGGKRWYLES